MARLWSVSDLALVLFVGGGLLILSTTFLLVLEVRDLWRGRKKRQRRLPRRQRSLLRQHVDTRVEQIHSEVSTKADSTEREIERIEGSPSEDDVAHWLRHSLGSWKKNRNAG